jgi:phage regulator Rha-like protein
MCLQLINQGGAAMKNVQVKHETIEQLIHIIRGKKVILDADLARVYGVTTKRLNEAVKRNSEKFPDDFMFRLTTQEMQDMNRSQFATGSKHRDPQSLPYAFTEHGAIMVATVLNSPAAVQMSVFVVRAFVSMRTALVERKELFEVLTELEKKLTERLDAHEIAIVDIIQRLLRLLEPPPPPPRKPIGFHVKV